jgi:transcriptional regulator with XRE-family HTH domain
VAEPPTPAEAWQKSLSQGIGRRVKRYRRLRGWTAEQLSKELDEQLGFDMKRAVIGNLETGLRQSVGLAEVLALARVLQVTPLELAVPVDEDEVEVLPGTSAHPWLAARWVTGEGPLEETPWRPIDPRPAEERHTLLDLYRGHEQLVQQWLRETTAEAMTHPSGLERARLIEDVLQMTRREIRRKGGAPPPVPPGLAAGDAQEPTEGG